MPEPERLVLILKYCITHKRPTWHLLCAGGVFRCLDCQLEGLLDAALHRFEEGGTHGQRYQAIHDP